MELSVVVPTLNGREELARCLDALADHVPDAETVVVNGPSSDGTTGMVRDRDDVDVLVEISDRSDNAARNAGIDRADGDVVALLDRSYTVEAGWLDAVADGIDDAAVVTGPTHEQLAAGMTTESAETATVAGRDVSFFNPGNVAFERSVLTSMDGFDESLDAGGARDLAHRLAGAGHDVAWSSGMSVRHEYGADGGVRETEWGPKYRSLSYRLVKNYGLRPTVLGRVLGSAGRDAFGGLRGVLAGDSDPSEWLGTGRSVTGAIAAGIKDGLIARFKDRSWRRNPNGRSTRADRAVAVYDER
ncbi:glycosyltransferase family 2 protein [Halomicrobium salinisoli]|uniref:glycosyltransferase family 2 protein n=1 Tax=Halomicrobium salinisoli TaxID=2878391 RepID=UPI001CF0A475|nr:glycosyltransferase [Halomicrobium salinisoli]